VDDNVIRTLRRQIASDDTSSIRNDLRYAPAWVAAILRQLITPET